MCIEIIPDFETKTTAFHIKKDRFGYQGMKIECAFDKGKYIPVTAAHMEQAQKDRIDNLLDQAGIKDMDDE